MIELKTDHLNREYITQNRDYSGAGMNAVIIYEQCDLALKANAMLERAALSVDEFQWDIRPWCMQLVLSSTIGDLPLVDAAEAHLVVLAIRNPGDVPPRLLKWLDMWAACRSIEHAGLAVFDGSNGDMLAAPMTSDLAQFANRHGLCLLTADKSTIFNDRLAPLTA